MNAPANSFIAALDEAASAADAGESRRAALLLHTVSDDDRAWLLSQMDGAERARLQGLVDELRAIGIPPAPELLDELGPAVAARVRGDAGHRGGLQHADPVALAAVLAAEPSELIARVIAQGPWTWTGALLARLGALQRQQVMDSLAALPPAHERTASALDARLLAIVEVRLAQAPAGTASPASGHGVAGGKAGAGNWLRRWLAPARAAGGSGELRA